MPWPISHPWLESTLIEGMSCCSSSRRVCAAIHADLPGPHGTRSTHHVYAQIVLELSSVICTRWTTAGPALLGVVFIYL